MVKEEKWMKNFITLDEQGEKWIAWDETQAHELGRFTSRDRAISALKERGKELNKGSR